MSGNGTDMGHVVAMLQEIVVGQGRIERDVSVLKQDVSGLKKLETEMQTVKQDIADLRQAVTQYQSSVLGHGILIPELEFRMRRVENHLDLPPPRPPS